MLERPFYSAFLYSAFLGCVAIRVVIRVVIRNAIHIVTHIAIRVAIHIEMITLQIHLRKVR